MTDEEKSILLDYIVQKAMERQILFTNVSDMLSGVIDIISEDLAILQNQSAMSGYIQKQQDMGKQLRIQSLKTQIEALDPTLTVVAKDADSVGVGTLNINS